MAQLKEFEENLNYESDNYVKMQIINTLITHYLFIKDSHYKQLISEAVELTKYNKEYSIYTLSNTALINLVDNNDINLAYSNMLKALELCNAGQNWLALKQCLDDWDAVIEIYQLNYPLTQLAFQKWHLILQKELLPNLYHLANLYAFLQQL
jgi:hypothetical protein